MLKVTLRLQQSWAQTPQLCALTTGRHHCCLIIKEQWTALPALQSFTVTYVTGDIMQGIKLQNILYSQWCTIEWGLCRWKHKASFRKTDARSNHKPLAYLFFLLLFQRVVRLLNGLASRYAVSSAGLEPCSRLMVHSGLFMQHDAAATASPF